MAYRSEWWSVDLPPDWFGYPDVGCSTFRAKPPLGVLQISAANKADALITDRDLQDFAVARLGPGVRRQECSLGSFSGFNTEYRKDGLFWQEWWLRSGHLMIYIAYNVNQEHETAEQVAVARILSSLAVAG